MINQSKKRKEQGFFSNTFQLTGQAYRAKPHYVVQQTDSIETFRKVIKNNIKG